MPLRHLLLFLLLSSSQYSSVFLIGLYLELLLGVSNAVWSVITSGLCGDPSVCSDER